MGAESFTFPRAPKPRFFQEQQEGLIARFSATITTTSYNFYPLPFVVNIDPHFLLRPHHWGSPVGRTGTNTPRTHARLRLFRERCFLSPAYALGASALIAFSLYIFFFFFLSTCLCYTHLPRTNLNQRYFQEITIFNNVLSKVHNMCAVLVYFWTFPGICRSHDPPLPQIYFCHSARSSAPGEIVLLQSTKSLRGSDTHSLFLFFLVEILRSD